MPKAREGSRVVSVELRKGGRWPALRLSYSVCNTNYWSAEESQVAYCDNGFLAAFLSLQRPSGTAQVSGTMDPPKEGTKLFGNSTSPLTGTSQSISRVGCPRNVL